MQVLKLLLLATANCCFLLISCETQNNPTAKNTNNLGDLHADVKVDISKNIKVDKKYYKITYNLDYKSAVKVSYNLTRRKVNSANIKGRPNFYPENLLDKKYQTLPNDYTNTGYDRGHLANDASFDSGKKSLLSTYSMANIVPMLPDVNRGGWLSVENYERDTVNKFKAINVVNIVTYKTNHLLKKKPLEEVIKQKRFKSIKHRQNYIKKYQKSAARLAVKRIHQPIGFYKIISSKRGDYKACFYVRNHKSSIIQNHNIYTIDCKSVPKI